MRLPVGSQHVFTFSVESLAQLKISSWGFPNTVVWSSSLLFPCYFSLLSLFFLVLRLVLLLASNFRRDRVSHQTHSRGGIKPHISSFGVTSFALYVSRFIACIALLCVSIADIFSFGPDTFPDALPLLSLSITYVYATLLALATVFCSPDQGKIVVHHLNSVTLFTFIVHGVRNLYPLMTFTKSPMDLDTFSLLWTHIALLAFASLFVPLFVPRRYTPIDPQHPMEEPNPEQTASIASLNMYTFMDPVVWKGNKLKHLDSDQMPPLSDYDDSKHLKAMSFTHLDFYSGAPHRHLFFGLMRVFRVEYSVMALMTVLLVFSFFISPIAINRLLSYIETSGEGAVIRPWVWVVAIAVGPTIGTLASQWYIFIATRTLVRTESILTQLVFDHSLRIRMKAETDPNAGTSSSSQSMVTTPDSTSDTGDDEQTLHSAAPTEGDTTLSTDETVQGSTRQEQYSQKKAEEPVPESHSSASNLVGKINNLVSTDLTNVVEARDFLLGVIYIPLQVILGIWFLYILLGWSALVGLATMLVLFPLPGYGAKLVQNTQASLLERSDARVQMITDSLNVLRMIKLFAWEKRMEDKVAEKRADELVYVRWRKILELLNGTVNFIIPCLAMLSTFTVYTVVMGESLTASKIFSSLSVFDMLREQLFTVFWSVTQALAGKVSLDRINDFLKNTELLDKFVSKEGAFPVLAEQDERIGFRNASFTWSADADGSLTPSKRKFVLRIDDELLFERGKFNIIVGPTGSGKSSILMALLGEMHFIRTDPDSWFNLPGVNGVAYAPQEPFIENATIQDNILFGEPYDVSRYQTVIKQCALERDFTLFEAGDQTEIGEKGLTLSGGQKARIALARAVYSSKDIILLDDVLAALDVHTSKWIVENCLSGELIRNRTVLLVTHHVALCRKFTSFVVAMDINGRIASKGTLAETLADYTEIAVADEEELQTVEDEVDPQSEQAIEAKKAGGKLIVAEEKAEGHISWVAMKLYLNAMGGSFSALFFLAVIGGSVLTQVVNSIQTLWLGVFAGEYLLHPGHPEEVGTAYYLAVYTLLLFAAVAFFATSNYVYIFGTVRASNSLHRQLVEAIFGTTLRWLDTTPISRVITRCTQDVRSIDITMSNSLFWVLDLTSTIIVKFVAVIISVPTFLLPGVVASALGAWIGQVYIAAQLAVKREMSASRSPVLAHFGAAIAGLPSIRAYHSQDLFVSEQQKRINRYSRSTRTFYNLNRWVCVRIDLISSLFAAGLAGFLVYGPEQGDSSRIGFTLNMAIGFSSMILWWVRTLNEFEVEGNSLERIQEYVSIEQEPKPTMDGMPPAAWPTSGDLRVEKLSARYSLDGPKVLKDISFEISSGERIGIVGRTGSGKSSLTLALLRCIFTEGSVYYDGIRTQDLNLDALRSQVTIIPQMPELLKGSLRENLDPFDTCDDATLNDALRAAGLFTLQQSMEEGQLNLDSPISSSGGNLSVGQRQIIALARALVRGSKLLILDEATSAIDFATDSIIQTSLRNELKPDMTLITIAHRLQTVFDFDRIMVLDAGTLVEFDSPLALIEKEGSSLRALVDESPDRDLLWSMAEGKKTR